MPGKKRRHTRKPPKKRPTQATPKQAFFHVLDQFTKSDLEKWDDYSQSLDKFAIELFYATEGQRAAIYQALCDAAKSVANTHIALEGGEAWGRVVSYKYSLQPLSTAGSIKGIGGRFNYGMQIDETRFQSFPSLYIASDEETARAEKFPSTTHNATDNSFYSLGSSESYAWVRLKGQMSRLIDLRTLDPLKPITKLIQQFELPSRVFELAKKIGIAAPKIIRTPSEAFNSILEENWRVHPMLGNIPSNSQVFGKLAYDSGVEGIIYPSQKGPGTCIALFPANFSDESYIELTDPSPEGVQRRVTVIP